MIRDQKTGESRTFDRTKAGYAAARDYQRTVVERGHEVGDDNSGSLRAIDDYLGPLTKKRGGWF
ncbi:hypothetical protein IJH29_00015 [Candidatus Saccharibacteria bacterium]|nr:hypothetical protein [Candidatus Saccharibacteria bacterium]